MMEKDESPLKDFLISCLTKKNAEGNFLYFSVANVPQIQNLMENLIWNMLSEHEDESVLPSSDQRSINQVTMGLLFLNLLKHTDAIHVSRRSYEQDIIFRLLRYIDTDYRDASLSAFSGIVSEDQYVLSRMLKKNTGSTFKELLQNKRLMKACELLKNTDIPIADISVMVGYDNTSFFHRLFRRIYGQSPREYRLS